MEVWMDVEYPVTFNSQRKFWQMAGLWNGVVPDCPQQFKPRRTTRLGYQCVQLVFEKVRPDQRQTIITGVREAAESTYGPDQVKVTVLDEHETPAPAPAKRTVRIDRPEAKVRLVPKRAVATTIDEPLALPEPKRGKRAS